MYTTHGTFSFLDECLLSRMDCSNPSWTIDNMIISRYTDDNTSESYKALIQTETLARHCG